MDRYLHRLFHGSTLRNYPSAFLHSSKRTYLMGTTDNQVNKVIFRHDDAFVGITEESTRKLHQLIEKNHLSHHCYFNKLHFHNHLTHHLVSSYWFGANANRLEEIYEKHASYQKPIPNRHSERITDDTLTKFLGPKHSDYYADYLDFFNEKIKNNGVVHVVQKYAFHEEIFPRLFGGVLHAFIHLGNGLDVNSPLLVSEGLAMACVSDGKFKKILLNSENISDSLSKLSLKEEETDKEMSALQIIHQIAKESRFDGLVKFSDENKTDILFAKKGDELVRKYVQNFKVKLEKKHLQEKLHEVYHLAVLLYASTGIRSNKIPHLDFFLMHGLTSAAFLVSYVNFLYPKDPIKCAQIIHAHFTMLVWYYVTQGRPKLNIDGLLNYNPRFPEEINQVNPWFSFIKASLMTSEEHQSKVLRSLYRAELLFSHQFTQKNLEGGNKVYTMASLVTADTIAGVPHSKANQTWDFNGIGWDQAWEHDNSFT